MHITNLKFFARIEAEGNRGVLSGARRHPRILTTVRSHHDFRTLAILTAGDQPLHQNKGDVLIVGVVGQRRENIPRLGTQGLVRELSAKVTHTVAMGSHHTDGFTHVQLGMTIPPVHGEGRLAGCGQ
jgi:hypothetical protein